MVDKNVVEDFLRAIQTSQKNVDHTYNATVTRIDDTGIVWVQLAGSDKETPTASTSSEVKMGDSVNVQWRNNQLYIAGNYSNPSAGSIRVNAVEAAAQIANQAAYNAISDANVARQAAEDAQASADAVHEIADNASEYAARAFGNLATVQSVAETLTWITQHGTMTLTTDVALDPTHVYFVQDAGGDYVVGGVTYAIVTEPKVDDIGTYYVLSIDESLNNYVGTHLALTGEGLWLIPEAGGNKVLVATGSGSTYTDAGTYIIDENNKTLAQFLSSGIQIGQSVSAHMAVDNRSLKIYDYTGANTISEIGAVKTYIGSPTCFTFGIRKKAENNYDASLTYNVGDMVLWNGYDYVCIEKITTPEPWTSSHWKAYVGAYSVAEGDTNIALGRCSHAEGYVSTALGNYSHAEASSRAYGANSHAEGNSAAYGSYSHAENLSDASGDYSHAEGYWSSAYGDYSHAQNLDTTAWRKAQTAIGSYNITDTGAGTTHPSGDASYGQFAFIIGNGTSGTPSNALTVDWSGNVDIASGASYTINGENAAKVYLTPKTATVSGSTGALYLHRTGNVVHMSSNGAFRSKASSIASGATLSQTIPAGYRPINRVYCSAQNMTSTNTRLEFTSDGSIMYYGNNAWTSNMYIYAVWVTGDSMPV